MAIPTPVEFWTLNNTLVGINGNTLVSTDGLDHYVPGKIEQGWDFANLAGRELKLSSNIFLRGGDLPFSLSLWFRPVVLQNEYLFRNYMLWNVPGGGTSYTGWAIFMRSTGKVRTIANLLNPPTFETSNLYQINTWSHVCVRYDGSGAWSTFLNGVKTSYSNATIPATPTIYECYPTFGEYVINAAVDSLGWFDVALSDAEVAELYNSGLGWEPSASDTTPDTFSFTDVADADLSTEYISNSQTITGMDSGTVISVSGGEYRLDGGAWTSVAGTINPGQTLELRATSSSSPSTVATVSVTVGDTTARWTITTKPYYIQLSIAVGPYAGQYIVLKTG